MSDLLQKEREADLQSYQRLIQSTSIADRRAAGLTWYPVAIRNTEIGRRDYLIVEAERTTHHEINHQLRFGASAVLFSNHNPKENREEGVISFQNGNRLKITLRTEELSDWANDGKLGIELLFDNNSYEEMQRALKEAAKRLENDKNGHLIKVLTGENKPSFDPVIPKSESRGLNSTQQEALNKIISAQELAVVHGPPGTGKTTTLVQAIKAMIVQNDRQVLVVAPSNAAVDLLAEKLSDEGLNVLRVGNPVRVSDKLMSLTLDAKMNEHASMKESRALKKQANDFRNMAHKYKRNFGPAERQQRKALFDEAHKIMRDVENIEQFIQTDIFSKAQVVTATLVSSNHYTVRNLNYHTVVIDEAGQALEPACWIPILKAEKVVFAGDHFQLPPTIKSDEAGRMGLLKTLMEKCVELHPETVAMLREQYRMNEAIMGYSSEVFYGKELIAHESVANHLIFSGDIPLAFIDTAGCGFDEKLEGTSATNPDEAAFLIKHLEQYLNGVLNKDSQASIGIISPYKEQINILKELADDSDLKQYADKLSINTVDSFQGQERDIVYISLVRSNPEGNIGFLSDIRRMNVAMTRARKKLVVIGDSATLSRLKFYQDFITYAEKLNSYHSAWEFMQN